MGAVCFCPPGYETRNDTNYKKCVDINECNIETSCSQKCVNTNGAFYCACDSGYIRISNKYCKSTSRQNAKVFVANGNSIMITNLEATQVRALRLPSKMRRITAFDFNNRTGRIYWADRSLQAIFSSFENGSQAIKLIDSGLAQVESIAVDWIGGNLYWADYLLQHIEVSNINGKNRRILLNENVTNPRGLVLDPRAKNRYMFWTDWGKWPRIERANMDGSNRTAIITTKIFWPNGLAIDLSRERLYFADAHLDYIESCDYQGKQRTILLANDLGLHHPHSLSFFEDHIFWVDRGHRQLIKTSRFNTRNKTSMLEISSQALNVKIGHSSLQPSEENPCTRSNCEHLCLLTSASLTGYKCACQIGYVTDETNGNRCNIDQTEFLLVLNENIIGGLRIFANDTSQSEETETQTSSVTNNKDEASPDSPLSTDELMLTRESGFTWTRMVPVNDITFGYDFTYDYREQYIYWLQHSSSSYSISINF
jgi:low density lipoprotein-related protein 2